MISLEGNIMADSDVKILGDVELSGALTFNKNYTDFPNNPALRSIVVKEGIAYIYTELVNGSGYFSWQPLSGISKQTSYLHTQGVASSAWTVNHGFNSNDFAYFVYDEAHNLVFANIEIIDTNTARIVLTSAMTGTAVFFSVEYINAQNLRASTSATIGEAVLATSSNGKLTVDGNEIALYTDISSAVYNLGQRIDNVLGNTDAALIDSIDEVTAAFRLADTAETTARTAAIAAEAAARAAADTALSSRINNVLSNIDPDALDSLTELLSAFQSADSSLSASITSLSTAEAAARAAADTALGLRIDGVVSSSNPTALAALSELVAAFQGSGSLSTALQSLSTDANSALATETAARIAADSTLNTAISTLSSTTLTNIANAVATEAANRASQDGVLSSRITNLSNSTTNSIDALTTNTSNAMSTEAAARTSADTAINARIDMFVANTDPAALTALGDLVDTFTSAGGDVLASVTALSESAAANLATERTARIAADTTNANAIAAEVSARIAAVNAEIAARTAADTAELTARNTAIAAEVAARNAAIAVETANRDVAIYVAVAAEAEARDIAITSAVVAQSASRTDSITGNFTGVLSVTTGTVRYYPPRDITIDRVYFSVGTAPTAGASVVIDVKKSGVSIFGASKPTLATDNYQSSKITLSELVLSTEWLTIDITSTGGGASDATVVISFI